MTLPMWLAAAGIVLAAAFLGAWWGYKGAQLRRDWRLRQDIDDLYDLSEVLSNRMARREGRAGVEARETRRKATGDPLDEATAILAAARLRSAAGPPAPPPIEGDVFDLPQSLRLQPGRQSRKPVAPPPETPEA